MSSRRKSARLREQRELEDTLEDISETAVNTTPAIAPGLASDTDLTIESQAVRQTQGKGSTKPSSASSRSSANTAGAMVTASRTRSKSCAGVSTRAIRSTRENRTATSSTSPNVPSSVANGTDTGPQEGTVLRRSTRRTRPPKAEEFGKTEPPKNKDRAKNKEIIVQEKLEASQEINQDDDENPSSDTRLPSSEYIKILHRNLYEKFGSPVPDSISFLTGKAVEPPAWWSDSQCSNDAAKFIKQCNDVMRKITRVNETHFDKDIVQGFDTFRRIGYVDMDITFSSASDFKKRILQYTPPPRKSSKQPLSYKQILWKSNSGEPASVDTPVSVELLRKAIDGGKVSLSHCNSPSATPEELFEWIDAVFTYQHPTTSPWKAPLVRCVSQTEEVASKCLRVRIHLYVSRLIFWMIANRSLRTLIKYLVASSPISGPLSSLPKVDAVFNRSVPQELHLQDNQFNTDALLRSHESLGYKEYPGNPKGLKLKMRDYQLQTLQWMIDQERLPRGLNGCFWEERQWTADPGAGSFYISPALGEVRLKAPPLVRGGLVCEEMGLGKTLEFISLVLHDQNVSEPEFEIEEDVIASNATLFVVPDALLPQWAHEFEKCLNDPTKLCIATLDTVNDHGHYFATLRKLACCLTESELQAHHQQTTQGSSESESSNADNRSVENLPNPDGGQSLEIGNPRDKILFERVKFRYSKAIDEATEQIAKCDIVLTTYRNIQNVALSIQRIHWRRICLDEMQEIRSSTTSLARMCRDLSARSRWMISGTPIYTGIDDIHGELNFLGIIPFSCPDNADGFWSKRVKRPFELKLPIALERLGLLLEHVMMRHSKNQTYVTDSQRTILHLPTATTRYVGIPMEYRERALYQYLEALAVKALDMYTPHQQNRRSHRGFNHAANRPWFVAIELLRLLASSPYLINGGNGAAPMICRMNNCVREILTSFHRRGIVHPNQFTVLFSQFSELPGDDLRDFLLSGDATGTKQSSGMVSTQSRQQYAVTAASGAGASAGAMREHIAERLKETEEKLKAAESGCKEGFCSARGGSIPKLRWRWAIQAITSGKYLALLLLRSKIDPILRREVLRLMKTETQTFTIQAQKAVRIVSCTMKLEKARSHLETVIKDYERMPTRMLCSQLASLTSNFSFEVVLRQNTSLVEAHRGREQEDLKLCFNNQDSPIMLSDDPVRLRKQIIDQIANSNFWCQTLQLLIRIFEEDFQTKCSPGISLELPVLPLALKLATVDFEARYNGDGKRVFVPVQDLLEVDELSSTVKVRFLDGEVRLLSTQDVRCMSPTLPASESSMTSSSSEERDDIEMTNADSPTPLGKSTVAITLLELCRESKVNRTSIERIAAAEADLASTPLLRIHTLDRAELQKLMSDDVGHTSERDDTLAERRLDRLMKVVHRHVLELCLKDRLLSSKLLRDRIRQWYCSSEVPRSLEKLCSHIGIKNEDERKALVATFAHYGCTKSSDLDYPSFSIRFGLKETSTLGSSAGNSLEGENEQKPDWSLLSKPDVTIFARVYDCSPYRRSNRHFQLRVVKIISDFDDLHASQLKLEDGTVRMVPWGEIHFESGEATLIQVSATTERRSNSSKKRALVVEEESAKQASASGPFTDLAANARKRVKGSSSSKESVKLLDGDGGLVEFARLKFTPASSINILANDVLSVNYEEQKVTVLRLDNGLPEEFDIAILDLPDADHSNIVHTPVSKNVHESIQGKKDRISELKEVVDGKSALARDLRTYANTLKAALKRGAKRVDALESQGLRALQELIDQTNTPECGICLEELTSPTCTLCIHLFCETCISQHIAVNSSHFAPYRFACPLCRRQLTRPEIFRVLKPRGVIENKNKGEDDLEKAQCTSQSAKSTATRKVTRHMRRNGVQARETDEAVTDGQNENITRPPQGEVVESVGIATAAQWVQYVSENESNQALAQAALGLSDEGLTRVLTEALNANFVKVLRAVTGLQPNAPASHDFAGIYGSKISRLLVDLQSFATQEGKTVIFSQQRNTVIHLSKILDQNQIIHARIVKGDRIPALRAAVDSFKTQDHVRILLLQSSSAAAGLTLTEATRVILFEPFLKLGEEQQAINRVHRIGQTRPVETICYFARGTLEERMLSWRMASERSEADRDSNGQTDLFGSNAMLQACQSQRYLRYITGKSSAITEEDENAEEERQADSDHGSHDSSSMEDSDAENEEFDMQDLDSDDSEPDDVSIIEITAN